jgi:hypothetical protein
MNATKKCPNCGLDNDIGRSICANCTTPLTEYGKQVGMEADFERRLTKQVEALDRRPPIVTAMAILTALLSLPLFGDVIGQFQHVAKPDPENVNAISSAFTALGPIFHTVILVPLAIALLVLAFFTWTQRPWTWMVNLVVLGLASLVVLMNFHLHLPAILWLLMAGAFAYFWTRSETKAWFGLD